MDDNSGSWGCSRRLLWRIRRVVHGQGIQVSTVEYAKRKMIEKEKERQQSSGRTQPPDRALRIFFLLMTSGRTENALVGVLQHDKFSGACLFDCLGTHIFVLTPLFSK